MESSLMTEGDSIHRNPCYVKAGIHNLGFLLWRWTFWGIYVSISMGGSPFIFLFCFSGFVVVVAIVIMYLSSPSTCHALTKGRFLSLGIIHKTKSRGQEDEDITCPLYLDLFQELCPFPPKRRVASETKEISLIKDVVRTERKTVLG